MSSRALVLLTNYFPYGRGEEYLETELPMLARSYDRVVLVPTMAASCGPSPTRVVPEGVIVIPSNLRLGLASRVRFTLATLPRLRARGLAPTLAKLFTAPLAATYDAHFFARALSCFDDVRPAILASLDEQDEVTIYSYWLYVTAVVGSLLREELGDRCAFICSRAHRYDVDVDASPLRYLPAREYLLERLDAVFPVSEAGRTQILRHHQAFAERVGVRRLGVTASVTGRRDAVSPLQFVSCSTFNPAKRIDFVIAFFADLQERGVAFHWTHLGEGGRRTLDSVRAAASRALEAGTFTFTGALPNTEVREWYVKNRASYFVNLSSSEGIPVSIMEALAAGIPVIATAVGGVPELVEMGVNGFLVPPDASARQAAGMVQQFMEHHANDYSSLVVRALASWRRFADADRLYSDFAEELVKRAATSDQGHV